MAVIAKFRCEQVKQVAWPADDAVSAEEVKLTAVYSSDPDHPNHEWSKYTPSGDIEIHITNPSAFGYFEPGGEYTVTLRRSRQQTADEAIVDKAWEDVQAGRVVDGFDALADAVADDGEDG